MAVGASSVFPMLQMFFFFTKYINFFWSCFSAIFHKAVSTSSNFLYDLLGLHHRQVLCHCQSPNFRASPFRSQCICSQLQRPIPTPPTLSINPCLVLFFFPSVSVSLFSIHLYHFITTSLHVPSRPVHVSFGLSLSLCTGASLCNGLQSFKDFQHKVQ